MAGVGEQQELESLPYFYAVWCVSGPRPVVFMHNVHPLRPPGRSDTKPSFP